MNSREVYEEKKNFVDELSRTLARAQLAEKVEYKNLDRQYLEFVRMTFLGGKTEYVNVTGNSLKSIFIEISRVINGQEAIGSTSDLKMQGLIDNWWDNAK